MHLILTGATGLVGSGVLHHILSLSSATAASRKITRVSILSRRADIPLLTHPDRPTTNTYTQIEVIPHTDFKTYPDDLLAKLGPIASDNDGKVGVIWALGISQTEVKTTAEYIEITKEYAIEAAKAFQRSVTSKNTASSIPTTTSNPDANLKQDTEGLSSTVNPHVNFIYVSGEGAQHNPGRFTPLFGKVKGETELDLLALMKPQATDNAQTPSESPLESNLRVYNVRPAGVDGHEQLAVRQMSAVRDARRNIGFRALKATLFPAMRAGVLANTLSPTEELGRVFVELASGNGGALTGTGVEGWQGRVVRNEGIRRIYRELETARS